MKEADRMSDREEWAPATGPKGHRRPELLRVLRRYARIGVALLAVLTLLGAFAPFSRFFELTTHFTALYLLCAVAGGVLCALLRSWRWMALAALLATYLSFAVLPWYVSPPGARTPPGAQSLRIFLANVYTSNERHGDLLQILTKENPDVILLQEVNDRWLDALAPLEKTYPHVVKLPRSDNFGMAVYSQFSLLDMRLPELAPGAPPSICFRLSIQGRTLSVLGCHTLPPVNGFYFRTRNKQLEACAEFSKEQKDLVLLAGDLNTAMWSPHYKRLMRDSGLVDARRGFGVLPTWPAFYPVLRIPLDHFLVSPEFHILDLGTGPHFGSDHLPLVLDLAIPGISADTPAPREAPQP